MKWTCKKNTLSALPCPKAFSLAETIAALVILTMFTSSVLVVIDRSIVSVAQSKLRMQAFEVVRENMEKLLAKNTASEMIDYGNSEKYPEIQWETTVETFNEPLNSQTWARAVCTAVYIDMEGQEQEVELTQWLTKLTDQQTQKLHQQQEKDDLLAKFFIETLQEAAEYATIDVETIQQWIGNGMLLTDEGFYIKGELDLYKQYDGSPPPEQLERYRQSYTNQKGMADVDIDPELQRIIKQLLEDKGGGE